MGPAKQVAYRHMSPSATAWLEHCSSCLLCCSGGCHIHVILVLTVLWATPFVGDPEEQKHSEVGLTE